MVATTVAIVVWREDKMKTLKPIRENGDHIGWKKIF